MKRSIAMGVLIVLCTITSYAAAHQVRATISFGELCDKITILQIKTERISDPKKLKNITKELEILVDLFDQCLGNRTDIREIMQELKETNENLWDIEDMIRIKERIKDFGSEFIQLARSVYITNDHRCVLKRKIDTLLNSPFMEEKSYASLTYEDK